jgi:hypothetical protein
MDFGCNMQYAICNMHTLHPFLHAAIITDMQSPHIKAFCHVFVYAGNKSPAYKGSEKKREEEKEPKVVYCIKKKKKKSNSTLDNWPFCELF